MDKSELITLFNSIGIFWKHDGNPKRPHALLTKGGHSNVFFNGGLVTTNPIMLKQVVKLLLEDLRVISKSDRPDWVIGPSTGAITLAYEIAAKFNFFGTIGGPIIKAGYAEKTEHVGIWKIRHELAGKKVLLCEDTLKTGGSVKEVGDACTEVGAIVLPVVATICNRSGSNLLNNSNVPIFSILEVPDAKNWKPEECPLCIAGSEAIRAKEEGWKRLNAEY